MNNTASAAQSPSQSHDPLMRIVARLLALAVLAERASGAPRAVCYLVLWILRPAEAAVREFVGDAAQTLQPAFAGIAVAGRDDSSSDAIRLALSFRALATALSDWSRQTCHFARRRGAWLDEIGRSTMRRYGVAAGARKGTQYTREVAVLAPAHALAIFSLTRRDTSWRREFPPP